MTAFKAQGHMRKFKETLTALLSGVTYVDSFDASFNPITLLTSAGESIYVAIAPVSNAGRVDSLGLSQTSYSPHQVTILQVPSANGTDFNTRYQTLACATAIGAKSLIYEINPLPGSYTLSGAALVSTIYPDPFNKLTNQQ